MRYSTLLTSLFLVAGAAGLKVAWNQQNKFIDFCPVVSFNVCGRSCAADSEVDQQNKFVDFCPVVSFKSVADHVLPILK
jgi:hypothetical protein